jgi:hypothetical protein
MKSSIAILLLRLVNCQCLATPNNVEIYSKKNGISKQFSIEKHLSSKDQKQSKLGLQIRRARSSILDFNLDSVVRTTFLPVGFPERTPQGYLHFSIWSWIQDLSTQLRAILATQRVLEGIGVGREGATALSASINFLVRDGFGMASTLMFTAVAANKFRANVKKWRMFADVINDVGITIEVAATLFPKEFFLPILCKFSSAQNMNLIVFLDLISQTGRFSLFGRFWKHMQSNVRRCSRGLQRRNQCTLVEGIRYI